MAPAPTDELAHVALAAVAQGWAVDDDAPLLLPALEEAGVRARPAMWDDPSVDWSDFDLVVIRSTWDYAERPAEFIGWAESVGRVTTLANPAPVVRWNIDKHYLGELAAAGAPVVPTAYLEPGADAAAVERAITGGVEVVVKPTVSAGSKDTVRHGVDAADTARRHAQALLDDGRSVMVQPYLSAVDRVGETGLVYFDLELSHAFRKGPLLSPGGAPVQGLFAVEEIEPREPAEDELELAEKVLAAATGILGVESLLYARVDVIRDDRDRPTLLELELVEPSFFLQTDPNSAERAARAIAAAASAARDRRRTR